MRVRVKVRVRVRVRGVGKESRPAVGELLPRGCVELPPRNCF